MAGSHEVVGRLVQLYGGKALCIALFGSRAEISGQSMLSDYDVLIILKGCMDRSILLRLTYLTDVLLGGRSNGVMLALRLETGAFRNAFVTDRCSVERRDFAGVFHVNGFLARLFAPSKIVLWNIARNHRVLHGVCGLLRDLSPRSIPLLDLARMLLLSALMVISGLILSVIRLRSGAKLYYEGVKWMLLSALSQLEHPISGASLARLMPVLARLGIVDERVAGLYVLMRKRLMVKDLYTWIARVFLPTMRSLAKIYTIGLALLIRSRRALKGSRLWGEKNE